MQVTLPAQPVAFIDERVECGDFENADAVVVVALRLLQKQVAPHTARSARLRAALAEGEASGIAEDFSMDRLIEQLRQEGTA